MSESGFSGYWFIRSSTSRFFPAHSEIHIQKGPAGFELEVHWEKHAKLPIEKNFGFGNGVLKGRFCRQDKAGEEEFELVVTSHDAGFDGRPRLVGLLLRVSGSLGDEGTGVFVAEAVPREEPPGGST